MIAGGRSAGARVACRTARELGAHAVLALSFPLHPPGKPEKSRADELLGAGVPTLVVQGGNDPFGRPQELPEAPAGTYDLIEVRRPATVALPGALLSPVPRRPFGLRRVWRAAQLTLAVWAAACVHWRLGGRDAVVEPAFPYALVPAGAAVLAFCLVLTVLDGGILTLADHVPPGRAWRGLLSRSLAPIAVHGLAGLMMAVLWRSEYGPVAALLVLLPMCVAWWAFAQYHRERAAPRRPSAPWCRPSTSRTATRAATANASARPP
ncbi:hypothetical protein STENM327S_01657 [Streptomyces tendae]